MSNLKKDIEKILKDFVLWRTKIIDGKPVATYDKNMLSEWEREQYQPMEAVTQIINLVEESEQKLLAKMTLDSKTVDYQGEQWNAILVKKLKNITLEQDEDIPNGAWDTIYAVINVGCLECENDSELVATVSTLEKAKVIAEKNYPKDGLVYGKDYSARYAEMQTVIFPITLRKDKGGSDKKLDNYYPRIGQSTEKGEVNLNE